MKIIQKVHFFLTAIWLIFGISSGFAKQLIADRNQENQSSSPNIILIVGESHRAEALAVAGNPFIKTPNLDFLASNGLRFENAHVTTAICSVSRASILSGQHQSRHGIDDFAKGFSKERFNETLPMQLKSKGYSLAWIGPYGVGQPPAKEIFDYWDASFPWLENGIHHTDNVSIKTNNWLEKSNKKQPFFIQINFSASHEIDPKGDKPAHYLLQERFNGLYNSVNIPTPKSADPKVWESFPLFFQTNENIARQRWLGFFSSNELATKNTKDYYSSVTGVDDAIGSIMKKLKEQDLDRNTIIVYISDHGFSLGEHGIMGKWFPFNESTHVPLIIYNPLDKNLKGKVDKKSIALNIDIAPTILGLINQNAPEGMQGLNLIQMFEGKIKRRTQFFYEHTFIGSPGLPKTEALYTKNYKYINFTEHNTEILYDLKKDPHEMVNLANNPKYRKILEKLRLSYSQEKNLAK